MATFAHQSAADNQVRHLPLATALKLHEGNYTALLAVLQPLKEAARESPLLKRLLDNGKFIRRWPGALRRPGIFCRTRRSTNAQASLCAW